MALTTVFLFLFLLSTLRLLVLMNELRRVGKNASADIRTPNSKFRMWLFVTLNFGFMATGSALLFCSG